MDTMDKEAYWIWLSLTGHAGRKVIEALLERFGDIEDIYGAESYDGIADIDAKTAEALMKKDLTAAREALDRTRRAGARVIVYGGDEYPAELMELEDAPAVLYVQGVIPTGEVRIAVVGTRKHSRYAKNAAVAFCRDFAAVGAVTISGMARGIDSVAADSAIFYGGKTIAVLGSGIDVVYPPENREMMKLIAQNGAVITRFPPQTPPYGRNFPIRNRIIAALSDCGIVIEAPEKSGALITADFLLKMGKNVYTVPGSIFEPLCVGSNRLLQNGAKVALCADDILKSLPDFIDEELSDRERERVMRSGYNSGDRAAYFKNKSKNNSAKGASAAEKEEIPAKAEPAAEPVRISEEMLSELDDESAALVRAVMEGVSQTEDIVDKTGIEISEAMIKLADLEMRGLLESEGGNSYRVASKQD